MQLAPQNPDWTREQLILALDLYFRLDPKEVSPRNTEVKELSDFLRKVPFHLNPPNPGSYRSLSSVCKKLANFQAVDPGYPGKGLTGNGYQREEKAVWAEFSSNLARLRKTAMAIRSAGIHALEIGPILPQFGYDEEVAEGQLLFRVHLERERNPRIVRTKKAQALARGEKLSCEVCGLVFEEIYGPIGAGYIECHHTKPLAEWRSGQMTRVSDLAFVCSNCHRMLHRSRVGTGMVELASIVAAYRGVSEAAASRL